MKKLHTSWILAGCSMGIMAGAALSISTHGRFLSIPWLVIGVCLLMVSLINRRSSVVVLAVFAGLLIGLWRGAQTYPSQQAINDLTGRQVSISGIVSEDVTSGQDGFAQVKLKDAVISERHVDGQVWISIDSSLTIKRSDRLQATGRLSEGFGSFSAAIYRAQLSRVTRIQHADPALEVRDWFAEKIRHSIKEPQASLGIGFLSGQHANLPENLINDLRVLGLTHIIVASGYNLTILVRFARRWLMGISKYTAMTGSLFLIAGFILVTGFSPSMTRAGMITVLSLCAWYYGRKIHPVVLLTFSAALTVLVNPAYLWGDLGWYLSFAAFAGVIILSPLILDYFWGKEEPNAILRVAVETFSAQLLTAPLIAFVFGQYAPLALLSNVLILPFIPFAMILTFLGGIGAVLSGSLAVVFGVPAQLLLGYMTFVSDKLADFPLSQGNISLSLSALIFSYLCIIMVCVWLWRRTKHDFRGDSVVE